MQRRYSEPDPTEPWQGPDLTPSFVSPQLKDMNFDEEYFEDDVDTLAKLFRFITVRCRDRPLFYTTIDGECSNEYTYGQALRVAENFARGIYHLGLSPEREDDSQRKDIFFTRGGQIAPPAKYRVLAFHLKSEKEYYLGEIACLISSIVRVGLYDTLGANATEHIINQSQPSAIVTTVVNGRKVLQLIKDGRINTVRAFIIIKDGSLSDAATEDARRAREEWKQEAAKFKEEVEECKLEIYTFSDVCRVGE